MGSPRPYLDLRDVAAALGAAVGALVSLASVGAFAPILPLGKRTWRVAVEELEAWEQRVVIGACPYRPRLALAAHEISLQPRRPADPAQAPDREGGSGESRDLSSLG